MGRLIDGRREHRATHAEARGRWSRSNPAYPDRCAICFQNCLRSAADALCHGAALRRIELPPMSACCLRQNASLSSIW
jgi:hypothetical protein